MSQNDLDIEWMQEALALAEQAQRVGEVPVGCVVVHEGELVGRGHNRTLEWNDPSAHAEIVALRNAADTLGNHRLNGCDLYVTLEPCLMCTGAIVHARIRRLVFAAWDVKAGACGGCFDVLESPKHNHKVLVRDGVLKAEAEGLLKTFFANKRQES